MKNLKTLIDELEKANKKQLESKNLKIAMGRIWEVEEDDR